MIRDGTGTGLVRVGVPIGLTIVLVGWVVAGHVARIRAESVAADFMTRLHQSQVAFRAGAPGFASSLASLTEQCPGGGGPWLDAGALRRLQDAGYAVSLRPRAGARSLGSDCHGHTAVDDYYAGAEPTSARGAAHRAYAMTATGRIFVFVDGLAPTERDMAAGGLATPLDALATFRIP